MTDYGASLIAGAIKAIAKAIVLAALIKTFKVYPADPRWLKPLE